MPGNQVDVGTLDHLGVWTEVTTIIATGTFYETQVPVDPGHVRREFFRVVRAD